MALGRRRQRRCLIDAGLDKQMAVWREPGFRTGEDAP